MKKISLFLITSLCLLLCSCGKSEQPVTMSLIHPETGKELKLDMSGVEASQLLDKKIEKSNIGGTMYNVEDMDDMYIFIHDNKTMGFSIRADVGDYSPEASWETSRGINAKSSFDEFKKAYPNAAISEHGDSITAYFIKEDDKYIEISEAEKDNYKILEIYMISLYQITSKLLDKTGSSSHLYIGNYGPYYAG